MRWVVGLGLCCAAGCGMAEPAAGPRPLHVEAKGGIVRGWRDGRGGAPDAVDLRARSEIAASLTEWPARGVGAALTLRSEHDLDGTATGDPFVDEADGRRGRRVAEATRAWVEARELFGGVLQLRAGRQAVFAGDRTWRIDGVRGEARAPGAGLFAFGGRRAATFGTPDRHEVWGVGGSGWPVPDGEWRWSLVHHLVPRLSADARHDLGRGCEARGGTSLLDGQPDRHDAALGWRPSPGSEIEVCWRRKSSRPGADVPFDDTDRAPGTLPARLDPDTRSLRLLGLEPFQETTLRGAWEALARTELAAEAGYREVLHRARRDLANWTGWTLGLGVEARDPLGWGCDASVRWRRQDADLPRPPPGASFVDPRGEGEEASDEWIAELRWRERPRPGRGDRAEAALAAGWRRVDLVSRTRRLRDVDGFWVAATVGCTIDGTWGLSLGYTYEEDFGLLDEASRAFHLARAEVSWRF